MRAHNRVIAPFRLRIGHIVAHQSPGNDIAQRLRLFLIKFLRLYQRGDHQTRIFRVLAGDAGKRDFRHLAGKIGGAGGACEGQHVIRVISQGNDR
ncbi:Uncharacterised protein [Salmonella enterica subsp. enterica serovar Bovismorbificans]|uniref:Uncharacterized protein n=1 Tax=Salmonella enterica subsp. enterica serovar Bovismorbificans TaxID=58097 RepID=A0A655DJQ0_SALET|nr:Uncharacterised protein [Salmonella enterica subsp. enterica serovar Bovismorbificans]CNU69236.1 Uncharacterised protein [Salmonella enterica subsp. enterica serovar Bovismorbificans]